jgi:hypothetical protein
MIGIPLGILIGVISAVIFNLLVLSAWKSRADKKALAKIFVELIAIPTFWFGGSWAASAFLKDVDMTKVLPEYITSLAVVFGLLSLPGLYKIIFNLAREIGQQTEGQP